MGSVLSRRDGSLFGNLKINLQSVVNFNAFSIIVSGFEAWDSETEAPMPSPLTCESALHPPTPSLNSLRPSRSIFTVASVSGNPLFLPSAKKGVRIRAHTTMVRPHRKAAVIKPSLPSTIAIATASINPEYRPRTIAAERPFRNPTFSSML